MGIAFRKKGKDMKILVAVKRVIDYQIKVRIKSDGLGVETQGVKMSMNPFDEIAVEAALQLKEKGVVSEVILVSVGESASQETLRHGLALGADRAILVKTDQMLEPINVANVLLEIVKKTAVDFVFLGKQAIDDDGNQTGQMLAGLLNWPQATFISEIVIEKDYAIVKREVDRGLQTIKVKWPAVITADLRLNTPRFVSLPNIMKAKSKPLETIALDELGLSLVPHSEILQLEKPKARTGGVKVQSIAEVLTLLKEKEGVIA